MIVVENGYFSSWLVLDVEREVDTSLQDGKLQNFDDCHYKNLDAVRAKGLTAPDHIPTSQPDHRITNHLVEPGYDRSESFSRPRLDGLKHNGNNHQDAGIATRTLYAAVRR
jgi:hypothetical protein